MLQKARNRAMISEVFNFLCSAVITLCLAEIASLLFVSVHETFRKKREEMRKFYRGKDVAEQKQANSNDTE